VNEAVFQGVKRVKAELARFAFIVRDEEQLQVQVTKVLADAGFGVEREVIAERGRYDILVSGLGFKLVLELKIKGSAAAAERQAQRYAMTDGVDAVAIVTLSQRLAAQIKPGQLGGKPFDVVTLRGF
jgi:hypothetical protein